MHLRGLIAFFFAALIVSEGFAQDKSQPRVDELVAKNVEAIQYDYRYRQDGSISGLPILPTLGVKGKF